MKDIKLLTPRGLLLAVLAVIAVSVTVGVLEMRSADGGMNGAAAYCRAKGDTINVAIAYSPMSLYRHSDTLGGLNYDIMKCMAAQEGEPVKFHPVSSVAESLQRLERGDYDMLIADVPVTASIRERFRVSEPVYTDHLVLVSRDSTLESALQLAGREVWVVEGSPAQERLENLSREIGDSIDIHPTDGYNAEQLVMLVSAGEIPAAVVNRGIATRMLDDCPDVKIASRISLSQFQCWFFRKDEKALADTIDAQLTRFKSTPAYRSILSRWTSDSAN